MTALTFLLPQSLPLVYTGQEFGYDHSFAFFDRDPLPACEPNETTEFYRRLTALRHDHPALAAGERGGEIVACGAPEDVIQVAASHTGRILGGFLAQRRAAGSGVGENQ